MKGKNQGNGRNSERRSDQQSRRPEGGRASSGISDIGRQLREQSERSGLNFGGKNPNYRLPPDHWEGDGIDHICIDAKAETDLGRLLDIETDLPFVHDIMGKFKTLKGLWYFVRSTERPEKLRFLTGTALDSVKRGLTNRKLRNTKAVVMQSAYQRIKQHERLSKLMFANELPFDCYSTNNAGWQTRPEWSDWVTLGYQEIQRALQSGTEPDFSALCDGPTDDIYVDVRPKLSEARKAQLEARAARDKSQKDEPKKKDRPPQTQAQPKPAASPKPAPVPKPAGGPKPARNDFKIAIEKAHAPVVPMLVDDTSSLFVTDPATHTTMTINGVSIPTGPVVTGVELPLVRLSNVPELLESGLIAKDDVIRGGQVIDKTFLEGYESTELARIERLIIGIGEQQTLLPIWLKVLGKSFERDGDLQKVTQEDGHVVRVDRDVLNYRQLGEVVNTSGERAMLVADLDPLIEALKPEDAARYKFGIFRTVFVLKLRMDYHGDGLEPMIYLDSQVSAVGISTGGHMDTKKEVIFFPEISSRPSYVATGYNFLLNRGKLQKLEVPAVIAEDAALSAGLETEAQPAVEDAQVANEPSQV